MKKILYKISTVTVIAFLLLSCDKFLEPSSPDLYVPKTVKALREMLIGSAYPDASIKSRFTFSMQQFYSDDNEMRGAWEYGDENGVFNIDISSNPQNFMDLKYVYHWYPSADSYITGNPFNFIDLWSANFELILACNAALDYVDKVEGSDEDKNILKAEALTLRAFYYYHLVNLYGEPYNYNKTAPGVPLKLTSNLNVDGMQRATVEQVYNQIIDDLDMAEEYFRTEDKEKWFVKSYRVTLPVVYNLKSRVYLYMENWEKAAEYSKMIMDIFSLSLYDLNTFSATTDSPYPNYCTLNNSETYWPYGGRSMLITPGLNGSIDMVDPADNSTKNVSIALFGASKSLINTFESDDLRKNYYLVSEWSHYFNSPFQEKYSLYNSTSKYEITKTHAETNLGDAFFASMRLSEAYLNYAEAVLNQPSADKQLAIDAINKLRENRINSDAFTPMTDITIEQIKRERRVELCFECHRWYDLRRWGMPEFERQWVENGVIGPKFKMEKNDAAYIMQIPKVIFERSPITEQNRLASPKF